MIMASARPSLLRALLVRTSPRAAVQSSTLGSHARCFATPCRSLPAISRLARHSVAKPLSTSTTAITEAELEQARTVWGNALVAISKAFESKGIEGAREVANGALDAAYGYNLGPVLFKPTLASGEQTFRPTRDGALSYFVGHDSKYPLDGGFGIKGWRTVVSETSATFIQGDVAMWMGWVTMTNKDGEITKVDKSWGYKKDADGTLRIVLHHSSLPYQP